MAKIRIVPLSEIGEIITGNTPKTSDLENYESNDIPFLKPSDFSTDNIDLYDTEFFISEKARNKARILPVGSVAVTCIGIIGKTKITQKECAFNQQINAIIPFMDNYNRYIAYAINFQKELLQTQANAAVVPIINKTEFSKIAIPLPPLETQKQIAANLDKVTHTIDLCNNILEKLDLLVKARFVEMFGDLANPECNWEKCKLVEACANNDDIKCGPFGTQLNKDEYTSSGVAVWEIPQINSSFQTLPTHFLTIEKAEQLKAYSLIQGDIAMARKGNVGKCAIYPKDFDNGIIHSDVLRIRLDFNIANPQFMMCQLHFSGDVQRQIEQVSSGAIMAGVNVTKLKQISVFIPPLDLQQQFAAFVEQTDKSKSAVKQVLEKAETLKKALMQEYFG